MVFVGHVRDREKQHDHSILVGNPRLYEHQKDPGLMVWIRSRCPRTGSVWRLLNERKGQIRKLECTAQMGRVPNERCLLEARVGDGANRALFELGGAPS